MNFPTRVLSLVLVGRELEGTVKFGVSSLVDTMVAPFFHGIHVGWSAGSSSLLPLRPNGTPDFNHDM